jgi:hypothetical protein
LLLDFRLLGSSVFAVEGSRQESYFGQLLFGKAEDISEGFRQLGFQSSVVGHKLQRSGRLHP